MERDGERIEITISSRFENIELVQVIAEHLCENAGMDEDGSHWIGMAVREAVANAIKHGNKLDVRKKVNATFNLHDHEREIRISDEGAGFDQVPELVAEIVGRGARVYAVEPRHESLEDRFMSLLGGEPGTGTWSA